MNDTTQKIAAVAADNFLDWRDGKGQPRITGEREQLIAIIQAAIEKATEKLRAVIKDDCATDTNVRELARPILGDFAVDGDSYGVPGLEDIVENLIKLRAAHASEPSWTVLPNGKESRSIDYINPPFRNVTQLVNAHNSTLQPAHAREPWTEETVLEITENLLGVKPTRKARKAIADAHNATLQPAHASEQ